MSAPRLSKSRFVAGHQCHKLLWLKVHEPGAMELEVDKVLQDRFDQGTHAGEVARESFPGGVLIDLPHRDPARITATRSALEAGAPAVFEASFEADGVFVAADVLLRGTEGFTLIEVKSSTSVKDEHAIDAALQVHVLRRSGIDVRRAEIMHLNPDFRHPDVGELFIRADVTPRVEALLPGVPAMIAEQLEMLKGALPEAEIGLHCFEPRECSFEARCWPQDRDHIGRLYNNGPKRTCAYMARGIHTIAQIPADEKLPDAARRQLLALKRGAPVVERGLAKALVEFDGALGFLDFETVSRAVPVWPALGPWRAATVQFSYHERLPGGGYRHEAYLAEGPGDPREELARAMLDATRGARRIVMYSSFERTRIRELAEFLPHLGAELDALGAKLIDLLPVVRNNVYHPDFRGSFSLKYILNPLVPELTYEDLTIVDGLVASVEIARLLFVAHKIPPEERDRLRLDLLAYCERDTWAMVKLLERLRELAAVTGG